MADIYKLYGNITINDNGNVMGREISSVNTYPNEAVYLKMVLGNSESKEVPFGTISTCKYLYISTDKECLVTLENGANTLDLTVKSILLLVDTALTKITITAGSNGANLEVLIAGE